MNMATSTVTVYVSYAQIAVFASNLQQPFNDWTDKHFAQGFTWRPGSVSFRTLTEAGSHFVQIDVTDHAGAVSADAVRVTEVPFEVPRDGVVEVASISDSASLTLPAGTFLLRCEFLKPDKDCERVHLVFAKKD